ncbi:MAG: hypothetical protein JSW00_09415 [Thermoplasmata archaeon]|nr:MAG: hypothetical protein JSW00_09415 [Thermoplasmata archaeon]
MVLDYWLTLISQKYFDKYGSKYLQVESLELNPTFQKSIKEGKYNPKHLLGIIFVIFCLIITFYLKSLNLNIFGFDLGFFYEFLVGFFILIFVSINSGHIQSIFYLNFIGKHPNVIEGRIRREMSLQYYIRMLSFFSISFILLFILIFNPTIFIFGGLIGTLIVSIWLNELYQKTVKK